MANSYQSLPLSSIPAVSRPNAGRPAPSQAEIDGIISMLSAPDATVTDGKEYADRKAAFNAANAAKRIAARGCPADKHIAVRTWQTGDANSPFRWAILLADGAQVKTGPRKKKDATAPDEAASAADPGDEAPKAAKAGKTA